MTLNQVIQTLKQKVESHGQIRSFFFGDPIEWLTLTQLYPSVCVSLSGPVRFIRNGGAEADFSIIVCDRIFQTPQDVNDTSLEANSIEVESDMVSVIEDLIAIIDDPSLDWMLKTDPIEVSMYSDIPANEDIAAGAEASFTLWLPNVKDRCAIP